jgi:phage shock protein E
MKTSLLILTLASLPLTADEPKPASPPAAEAKDGVKHVDAAGAKKLLDEAAAKKDTGVVVLDVRTPDEYKSGHIAGAANIDFNAADFAEKVGKLDKEKTYVVHCQRGGRSTKSLETFRKLGFKNLVHLDGGMAGWEKAKLPVEKK